MPFITEELWQRLETGGKSIALAEYPKPEPGDEEAELDMAVVQSNVKEIRQGRAANKIDRSQVLLVEISADGDEYDYIAANREAIAKLANVTLELVRGSSALKLNIPIDRARLEKENAELEKQIANLERQFTDTESLAKKPEKIVEGMRKKKAEYEAQLAKNRAALEAS